MSLAFGLIVVASIAAGCAPERRNDRPTHRWTTTDAALADLRSRASAVSTLSAECGITLTKPDGESVQFDGALALQNPGRVRLRAWKFNRAVLDVTLNPDGLFMKALDDPERRVQVLPAGLRAADFLRELSLFTGGFFADPPPTAVVRGDTLVLTRDTPAGPLHCDVDRATLTPRRFYTGDGNAAKFDLTMSDYRTVDGVAWPHRLAATSDAGTVVVRQRNVEINGDLAPAAFTPPPGAERRS